MSVFWLTCFYDSLWIWFCAWNLIRAVASRPFFSKGHSLPAQALSPEFLNFTQRTGREPRQCLRYCFEAGARPLWAHRLGRAPHPVPNCPQCGGPRRFEFQVMPQALHFMQVSRA